MNNMEQENMTIFLSKKERSELKKLSKSRLVDTFENARICEKNTAWQLQKAQAHIDQLIKIKCDSHERIYNLTNDKKLLEEKIIDLKRALKMTTACL